MPNQPTNPKSSAQDSTKRLKAAQLRAQKRATPGAPKAPARRPAPSLLKALAERAGARLAALRVTAHRVRKHPKRAYLGALVALLLSTYQLSPAVRCVTLVGALVGWAVYDRGPIRLDEWWWPQALRPTLERLFQAEAVARGYGKSAFAPLMRFVTSGAKGLLAGCWA